MVELIFWCKHRFCCLSSFFVKRKLQKIGSNFKAYRSKIRNTGRLIGGNNLYVFMSKIFVDKQGTLKIGDNVTLNQCKLICVNSVVIGNNVLLGDQCCVMDTDFHGFDGQPPKCRPVVIEDNVWVGMRAIIMEGVTVGKNSVVGAGSIVTKNVPCNCVVAGNPARKIREIKTGYTKQT